MAFTSSEAIENSRSRKDEFMFIPDVMAAGKTRTSRTASLLTIGVVVIIITFIAWAKWAVLDEVTRGEAKIVPSSRTKIIENLEGGIIAEMKVEEGDRVSEGQPLLRLDNLQRVATYRENKNRQLSLKAKEERLLAQVSGNSFVNFSEEILKSAPQAANDERRFFEASRAQSQSQIEVLKQQAIQKRQEITETQAGIEQLKKSLVLAQQERSIVAPMALKNLTPELELIRLDQRIADLNGQLSTLHTSLPRLRTSISEAELRVQEQKLKNRAEASDNLTSVRAELKVINESLEAGADVVQRTEVRSPVNGIVKQIMHHTEGGVVGPGEAIMEIVPLDDTLLLEARVRPSDIAFLRAGQKATVKLSAYDFAIYGGLTGDLERISADTITDERGESFYLVYLRTRENTLTYRGSELPIIPGMTATVDILTGHKSVLDYILKPILKARQNALREK